MHTPPRTSLSTAIGSAPPRTEVLLSVEELAEAAGISATKLARLVRLGLVEPAAPAVSERGFARAEFSAATAARLRRMLRLHGDLGVDLVGAAIIVDLLERLDRLEVELARQRGGP